jgi:diguanylate cyclase (GGDEF)-like protein
MKDDLEHLQHQPQDSELESLLQPAFFQSLLGRLEDPVFVKNARHQWVFSNEAFNQLIGCDDLIGKTDADLMPADQVDKFYAGDDHVIHTQTSLTQEEEIGEDCYALVKKIPITLPDGSPGLFGIIFDISEYRKVQLEVEKLKIAKVQSQTDPLTGLANRRHLESHYEELLKQRGSPQLVRGLLHIDLDYFKEINDSKGHLFGDAVLVHLANTLRSSVRDNDFIARIGGDEFLVVVNGSGPGDAEAVADRIIKALPRPTVIEGDSCTLSASIGIANDSTGKRPLNRMLKSADVALYRAKRNGRGRYEHFTTTIQHEHNQLVQQRDEFRAAIAENQFFPVYQPQFDCNTLELIGVEALARWRHPERGVLPPAAFLDLAKSENNLFTLDRTILEQAIHDARTLQSQGLTMPALSVNISAQSLATPDLIEHITRLSPLPDGICFELVESMLLDEPSGVVEKNLNGLRELGISLDIDDFGSGHASLLGLLEARPNRVKIDKRLVIPITESKKHVDLVRSIIHIANSLGMATIAEGVESDQHREILQTLGCQSIQGFGFAKPMFLAELQNLQRCHAA